jgi:phytoene dehydrogenase-like protein
MYDAVIVGSGPNGLAAGITLAAAQQRVLIIEGHASPGGGMRSLPLTLPGFLHDMCSAIHPLGLGSPFFQELQLQPDDLEWISPPVAVAHPMDDGSAGALYRDLEQTVLELGVDGLAWQRLMEGTARDWGRLGPALLGPRPDLRPFWAMSRFGMGAIWPASWLAKGMLRTERARALWAGIAAHAVQPLEWPLTSSFGLVLGALAHVVGWPFPKGGSQAIVDALVRRFLNLGGEIRTGEWVQDLDELPPARARLLDVTPRQLLQLAGEQLPPSYQRELQSYRYGPGVFKIDYALAEPAPWKAAVVRQAGTVHVGGTLAEIAACERGTWAGKASAKPFVLAAQPTLWDESRAPAGRHTLWAYCHVPHGSSLDMTAAVDAQIERFAPGFREVVLARATVNAVEMEAYNPNYVGGDIASGVQDWSQLWTRPTVQWNPYRTALPGLYLCSAATPPGGGVHGMCGYNAARTVLKDLGLREPVLQQYQQAG